MLTMEFKKQAMDRVRGMSSEEMVEILLAIGSERDINWKMEVHQTVPSYHFKGDLCDGWTDSVKGDTVTCVA